MKKNKVALLIGLVLGLGLTTKLKPTVLSALPADSSIESDSEKEIVDFRESLVTQRTAQKTPAKVKGLVKVATLIIHRLGTCIQKNLCGDQAEAGRAYFNPENTDSKRKLNRALRFTLSMEGSANSNELPEKSDLLPLLSVSNDETPALALEILLSQNAASCSEMISESAKGSGESLALVYSILWRSGCERRDILNAFQNSVNQGDPTTVQFLSQRMGEFHLSESEFTQSAQSFCRFLESPHRGKVLKNSLTAVIESHGFDVTMDQICGS